MSSCAPSPDAGLTEPLTDRERELLAYLPTRLTNAELAARFFVSVNTIKTHMAHIYRKLDAPNRSAAVSRATELACSDAGCAARMRKAAPHLGRPLGRSAIVRWLRLAAQAETLDQRAVTRRCRCPGGSRADDGADRRAGTAHDASGGRACAP